MTQQLFKMARKLESHHFSKWAAKKIPSPTEDLMKEHGALDRLLLVYEECIKKLQKSEDATEVIIRGAQLVQEFIEKYHEKLEEEFVFETLEKADQLTELTASLRKEHKLSRKVTAEILKLASQNQNIPRLIAALKVFIKMYRPHSAFEDTVVFPAFRQLASQKELNFTGEQFEHSEEELFDHGDGFEAILHRIEMLEKEVGLKGPL